jgi:hypothetical protein
MPHMLKFPLLTMLHSDFDQRAQEIEQETRHDVVAFTRQVSETLGEERKWVHYGLTLRQLSVYVLIHSMPHMLKFPLLTMLHSDFDQSKY